MPFLIILLVLIVLIVSSCVKIVPQASAYVVERLGAYSATWQTGLHFKTPFVERVARRVNMKEQVCDFPPQPVITKDNVTMQVDSIVFYQITDPKLFAYGVDNPIMAIESLTATTLRNIIGEMELDETLTSREIINTKMRSTLDIATDPWGIKVNRVEIKNIQPPESIRQVMETQMRAERERRQTVLEAEAHKEAVVSRAEGDKQAKILAAEAERDAQIALAEGRAKSIELVYQAEAAGLDMLNKANPTEEVLRLKGLESLKDVSDGRATKIYIPTDLAQPLASLGLVGEALGVGDKTPIDKSAKPVSASPKDPCIRPETGRGGREAAAASARINRQVSSENQDD